MLFYGEGTYHIYNTFSEPIDPYVVARISRDARRFDAIGECYYCDEGNIAEEYNGLWLCYWCVNVKRCIMRDYTKNTPEYQHVLTQRKYHRISNIYHGSSLYYNHEVHHYYVDADALTYSTLGHALNSAVDYADKAPIKRLLSHKYMLIQSALEQRDICGLIIRVILIQN